MAGRAQWNPLVARIASKSATIEKNGCVFSPVNIGQGNLSLSMLVGAQIGTSRRLNAEIDLGGKIRCCEYMC